MSTTSPKSVTPTPGDPSTEPVATAEQSHVAGRVGPPTIPQDAAAEHFVPDGVAQIEPGQILPAATAPEGGVVELEEHERPSDGGPGVTGPKPARKTS